MKMKHKNTEQCHIIKFCIKLQINVREIFNKLKQGQRKFYLKYKFLDGIMHFCVSKISGCDGGKNCFTRNN